MFSETPGLEFEIAHLANFRRYWNSQIIFFTERNKRSSWIISFQILDFFHFCVQDPNIEELTDKILSCYGAKQ